MRYSRAVNSRCRCVIFLLATNFLWAQKPSPPTAEELGAITARGKRLTEYDRAAHKAIAAVKAIHPLPGKGSLYLGEEAPSGWVFWFGNWDGPGKNFLTAYEARQEGSSLQFIVKEVPPEDKPPANLSAGARAMQAAMHQFKPTQTRPYSIAVIPIEAGGFYVYIYPSQINLRVYPLGGDSRFKINKDGAVVEDRQMHRGIIEIDPERSIPPGSKLVGGNHSHILSDLPEDTDVFHVLRQDPPLPEYIATKNFIYDVEPNGSIKIVKK
jgi:hypothetical protein